MFVREAWRWREKWRRRVEHLEGAPCIENESAAAIYVIGSCPVTDLGLKISLGQELLAQASSLPASATPRQRAKHRAATVP